MSNEALKSKGELSYNQFFSVLESKDYFIFYLTANQASLIRKKDVPQVDEFRKFIKEKFQKKFKHI
ncbi:YcxB family protein [Anaerotignum sp. MB30-C6]|uniref:YcxB family protein n=1 Tax=Anaerotignum sp. MB30-C6 TaxID=3070814 RepID=UPI0027DCF6AC|nr:YcxB family protein [Anaerotignum sp. MB30-C6]WMI82658.1 YcxB family protein [Anaerotignum sp. MB30-C6]